MSPERQSLLRLAVAYGIEQQWYDIWGHAHEVSEATLRAVLAAMHVQAGDDAQVQRALCERETGVWREPLPPAVVVRESALPARLVVRFRDGSDADELAWRLVEENGEQQDAAFALATLPEVERGEMNGHRFVARCLTLDAKPAPGYHKLVLLRGQQMIAETQLIVAPDSCYLPEAVRQQGRTWGPAAQLYTLRSERNWGIGDFTDLRLVLEQWAQHGADIVGLNPLHALFPHNPENASPYSPSSRLFLNLLYLDPERIDDLRECEEARELVYSSEFQERLGALRAVELVDYRAVVGAKMSVFELLYASFRQRHLALNTARSREFRDYRANAGTALQRHALFEALQEHFFREDPAMWGWPVWPPHYRDPGSAEVAHFAEAKRERVEFFAWLQWQAERQLAGVSQRALELQLGVGLYGDLAVSVDRGGAETWSNQDLYALSASVGAPPDDFSLTGQNWGLPPMIPVRLVQVGYAPFIATLRANMRHTGALRVDHVMGLMRLFWIPSDASPAEGAYVRYPFEALLGILALESHRNRCMVIGEDLGTVPDEVRRALYELRALSCRILYFERGEGGRFKAPGEYPAQGLVSATTHDLPTLAGFWEGRDLAVRSELNLFPSDELRERQILERTQDRARLLFALDREGLLPSGLTLDPGSASDMTLELMRAIQSYLARTPCKVLMIQLEDVLGQADQVNLPGTTTTYPNWRRKLTLGIERWPEDKRFVALCDAVRRVRPKH
jgi:(1->4)-alpha-D-glucan 1-alpha-D-glucosylmutase